MEEILEGLNPAQREAVETLSGPVLILAGAGSGKTKTLTHRIANLIAHGTRPENILAVTFTNKAAREMRERLWTLLNPDVMTGPPFHFMPYMGTFHGIAVRILREDGENLGIPANFVIYDVEDQQTLIKQVVKAHDISLPKSLTPKSIQNAISAAKNEGKMPEAYEAEARFPDMRKIAKVYKYYEIEKANAGALDFDDLMLKELQLFQQLPEVRKKWQERFEQILIDEYQDTNNVQYQIVKILVGKEQNICAVGDDWQSIYSWRGADFTNILHFERDFPGAKVIKLEQNYRSTGNILAAAQEVIQNNQTRTDKVLFTEAGKGQPVRVEITRNEETEALFVASTISLLAQRPEFQGYSDFAILYRTNAQSYAFEKAFMNLHIPYKIIGGVRFYDRKEVKDMLAVLRLVESQRDKVSLERVVRNVLKGIGDVSLGRILAAMNLVEGEEPLLDESVAGVLKTAKAKQGWEKLVKFLKVARTLRSENEEMELEREDRELEREDRELEREDRELEREMAELDKILGEEDEEIEENEENEENEPETEANAEGRHENPAELIKLAVGAFDFTGLIEGATPEDADDRIRNLEVLASTAEAYETLEDFLADTALMSSADEEAGQDAVTLMTIHASKGLEFPVVFLVGMEEGLFPSSRAIIDGGIEEERRLAYVGMTRAMKQLFLSYATSRYSFGGRHYNMQSEFLSELGVEPRGTGGYLDIDGDGILDKTARPVYKPDQAKGLGSEGWEEDEESDKYNVLNDFIKGPRHNDRKVDKKPINYKVIDQFVKGPRHDDWDEEWDDDPFPEDLPEFK